MSSLTSFPAPAAGRRTRHLVVVSAGLGQPSSTRLLADRLGQAASTELADRGLSAELEVLEVRELAHDLTTHLVNGLSSKPLDTALEAVARADGVIGVSPVFAASYSGLFKSFFDVIDPLALAGTPVLMAATGGSERHSLVLEHAMRPLFAYLQAVVMPTGVFAATADWGAGPAATEALHQRVRRAAAELADAVGSARPRAVADPFALPAGFDPAGSGSTSASRRSA